MVIHLGTRITTMLALLDDNGNVRERKPITVELSQLSVEQFEEARAYLENQWRALREGENA